MNFLFQMNVHLRGVFLGVYGEISSNILRYNRLQIYISKIQGKENIIDTNNK